jgi:hybrid cluster-associated redox disulfide protein
MKITKEMPITEIIQLYPKALEIFSKYNLGCLGCIAARFETLEDGLIAHGINVEEFLKEINQAVE